MSIKKLGNSLNNRVVCFKGKFPLRTLHFFRPTCPGDNHPRSAHLIILQACMSQFCNFLNSTVRCMKFI